jgi:hypothetical protein
MANPLINGVNYSWSNVKLVLFGVPVVGITQIEYKRKQKKDNNYGMGTEPISRGYGNKEYEGKITLYREEWNSIIAAAPSRDPLDISFFDIQVSFQGTRVQTTLDVLRACEFLEDPFTIGQGDTKSMVEIPLIIGLIDHVN